MIISVWMLLAAFYGICSIIIFAAAIGQWLENTEDTDIKSILILVLILVAGPAMFAGVIIWGILRSIPGIIKKR